MIEYSQTSRRCPSFVAIHSQLVVSMSFAIFVFNLKCRLSFSAVCSFAFLYDAVCPLYCCKQKPLLHFIINYVIYNLCYLFRPQML